MFSKSDKTPDRTPERRATARAAANATPSLISNNLKITGNLKTEGEVQIDGSIDGDVACGKLTIGEQAMIAGEITADEVVVHGKVTGRIRARSVQLARTAEVIGDIWHDTLSIDAGAFIEGHCKRNGSAAQGTAREIGAAGRTTVLSPLALGKPAADAAAPKAEPIA